MTKAPTPAKQAKPSAPSPARPAKTPSKPDSRLATRRQPLTTDAPRQDAVGTTAPTWPFGEDELAQRRAAEEKQLPSNANEGLPVRPGPDA